MIIGAVATEYESIVNERVNVALPHTLKAYEGVNVVYDVSGDVLTATTKKSVAAIIADAVEKKLAVNWPDYGLPMLYLTGDTSAMNKDTAVNLAYQYGDKSGTASVKWQGSSSLSYPKKNYTIKFDNAFEAVEGWGEESK